MVDFQHLRDYPIDILSLDDDIAYYILGIAEDSTLGYDEKREEKSTESLTVKILKEWEAIQDNIKKEEEKRLTQSVEDAKARERERLAKQEEEQRHAQSRRAEAKSLTKEQREERDRLLRQYGYDYEADTENNRKIQFSGR